jgi:hypothetical protein
MAAHSFDDHHIKWNKLGDIEHLLYSILGIDEACCSNFLETNRSCSIATWSTIILLSCKVSIGFMSPTAKSRRLAPLAATHQARRGTRTEKVAEVTRMLSSFSAFVQMAVFYTSFSTTT